MAAANNDAAFPAWGNIVIVVIAALLLLLSSVPRLDSRLRIGDTLSVITFYFVGVVSREDRRLQTDANS